MKDAPADFVARLRAILGEDYRVRWSLASQEWHIEQRVGPRRAIDGVIAADDDNHIRARDGYWLVLRVREGDRMPCPDCGVMLRVPVRELAHITCEWCRAQGRQGRHTAAFWPLDDSLLLELKRTRPENARELVRAADERNRRRMASLERELRHNIEIGTKENWTRLVGIPTTGYTGRAHAWLDAPEPRFTAVSG